VIGDIPIVSFDTSAHNRLVDDGVVSEPILAGLKSGFSFRFVGLSIDEMVATSDPAKRAALFTYCARLQDGLAECIYPHNELIKRMITEHHKDPASFNWKAVDVKAREYERAIRKRELFDDEVLSGEQRAELKKQRKKYEAMFRNVRPDLEEVFKKHGEVPPPTFRAAIARVERKGNLLWSMAKLLYDPIAKTDASEATVKEFMEACPPFRAAIYGMLMSWYDLAVRDDKGEKFEAGRNDMFMAVHLPYCDRFVTAEKHREQEKCLREVAFIAGLETFTGSPD
jgi:hypothetical protein